MLCKDCKFNSDGWYTEFLVWVETLLPACEIAEKKEEDENT